MKGVESVADDVYLRTVRVENGTGWISVRNSPSDDALIVEISPSLTSAVPALRSTLRHLFDLDARPDLIAAALVRDGLLAERVAENPGLRVPGAFDGFELALRAILGQQVTVKAATTLAGRVVHAFGEQLQDAAHPTLTRLSPAAERIAAATPDELSVLGITRARARSIIVLAEEVASRRLRLEPQAAPEAAMAQLVGLPGIGAWTAHYIAMRALRWADAFPKEDVALRNRLGGVSARRAEEMSQAWRPWRAYATLHLWQMPITGAA